MKQVCVQCHTRRLVRPRLHTGRTSGRRHQREGSAAKDIIDGLHKDGSLTGPPFSNPIDFTYFDLWHYDGRTASMAPLWAAPTSCSGMATTPLAEDHRAPAWPPTCGGRMATSPSVSPRAARLRTASRWARDLLLWIELFASSNLAILAGDIYWRTPSTTSAVRPSCAALFFDARCPSLLGSPRARWAGYSRRPGASEAFGRLACRAGGAGRGSVHLQSRFFRIAPCTGSPTPRPLPRHWLTPGWAFCC